MSSGKIQRRDFLKTAAAAVAVPYIFTRSARAAESSPNDRIVMGAIGCGIQMRHLINRFIEKPEVQLVATCDVDKSRREAAAKKIEQKYRQKEEKDYKGCAVYENYEDVIAREDIDAIVMAPPDHWHAAIAIAAMKAGKDIYCEKPLTLTIFEADQLVKATRQYGRVFQTGSMQRSSEEFQKACTLVRNGAIGKVQTVAVSIGGTSKPCDLPTEPTPEGLNWDKWLGQAPKRGFNKILAPIGPDYGNFPDWRQYREFSGGMMTDWGAHHFDIGQWGLGMDENGPIEIIPPKGRDGSEGYQPLTYKYANGAVMIRTDRHNGDRINGARFYGENGWIEVNRGHFDSSDSKYKEMKEEEWNSGSVKLVKSRDHEGNLLHCIRNRNERPICDVAIGASSATVCHIGNIAWWLEQPLKWDPAKHVFDNDEANRWINRDRRAPYGLPEV